MSGFENGVLVCPNVNFDSTASKPHNGIITSNGQLLIGAGSAPFLRAGNLTSTGGTITVTNGPGTINIDLAGGSIGIDSVAADTGTSPVFPNAAGLLNVFGRSGSKTTGSTNTLTIQSPPFSQVGVAGTSTLNSGEFVTAAVTRTLPVSAGLADGDLFIYVCTTAGALVIQSVGSQKIRIGSGLSGAAGSATSTAIGDSLTLRYNSTADVFFACAVIGTWTLSP